MIEHLIVGIISATMGLRIGHIWGVWTMAKKIANAATTLEEIRTVQAILKKAEPK